MFLSSYWIVRSILLFIPPSTVKQREIFPQGWNFEHSWHLQFSFAIQQRLRDTKWRISDNRIMKEEREREIERKREREKLRLWSDRFNLPPHYEVSVARSKLDRSLEILLEVRIVSFSFEIASEFSEEENWPGFAAYRWTLRRTRNFEIIRYGFERFCR